MADSRLRTVVVSATVGAVVAVGATAGATFPDTVNSPFREEIDHIVQAGCATGFNDGTFGPRRSASRAQFAAWMNRCGGRVEFTDSGVVTLATDAEIDVATASMEAGGVAAGGGFVVVNVAVEAEGGSSPGDVTFRLYRNAEVSPSEVTALTAGAESAVGGAMVKVFPVAGESLSTLRVTAQRPAGVATDVDVSLALLYVPFAGDGTGGGLE